MDKFIAILSWLEDSLVGKGILIVLPFFIIMLLIEVLWEQRVTYWRKVFERSKE